MTSKIYDRLKDSGPLPADEIATGSVTYNDKEAGVTRFRVSGGYGGTAGLHGQTTAIYYIRDYHALESIIRLWVNKNQDALEKAGAATVHHKIACNYNDDWKAASRRVLDPGRPEGWENKEGEQQITDCPLCGAELDDKLPDHLPTCSEA